MSNFTMTFYFDFLKGIKSPIKNFNNNFITLRSLPDTDTTYIL